MSPEYEKIIKDLQRIVKEEWTQEDRDYFFTTGWDSRALSQYHHTLGREIRNNYNLWEIKWEPKLIDGVDHSPEHPDNASSEIIKELWTRGLDEIR